MASAGSPSLASASESTATIAPFASLASLPPRRMTQFDAFRQMAAASAVAFGRAS
jgi:hypothetical protein